MSGTTSAPRLPGSLNANRRLSQWLAFDTAGQVTLKPGKVEIGQGILTALTQIAADELDVAMERIALARTVTGESPNEGVTSSSLSMQDGGTAVRHACAATRAIFLQVVAQRTGVPVERIAVEDGRFLGPDGAELGSYWSLAGAGLLETEAPADAKPKPIAARRLAGTSVARVDLPDKVFGAARFVHDLRLPGMLHARMVRPPSRRAELEEVGQVALPPGAQVVRDGNFLAVIAGTEWEAEALAARLAARSRWGEADTLPEEGALADWLDEAGARGDSSIEMERIADDGVGTPVRTVRRRFQRPFIAHASLAPSCAVARVADGAVEIWSHTQGVYNLRADVSTVLRLPPERVVVRHMEGAGCYGHNGADDVALEAALIARAVPGRPVRLLWTRAEELGWSPFSPAMLVEVEADQAADGSLLAWRSRISGNGHVNRPGRDANPTLLAASAIAEPFPVKPSANPPLSTGGGGQRNAVPFYRIPQMRVGLRRLLEMPIRCSSLRGLGALMNVWTIETVMDELAALAGEDPLDYRLRHLDDARSRAVLEKAAAMAGWRGRVKREGWGMGIAAARYKNSAAWGAVVAEVEARERIFCRRLWIAGDAGEIVNPDGIKNQYEGGAIHGVSVALLERVTFDRRRVTSDSWAGYPILRFSEVPKVEVEMINRPEERFLGA
ncbi:MAG: molybdopterin-dependent oxidoreductase, partial [Acetobacteraceae bacterium]|nr:molybdopterin-dependent oxidoreductase [Acetobacteraceae bacterium]